MKTIVNGNEVYYSDVDTSDSPPIILIHGFPFSNTMWVPQIEAFQKRFRVVAYDLVDPGPCHSRNPERPSQNSQSPLVSLEVPQATWVQM